MSNIWIMGVPEEGKQHKTEQTRTKQNILKVLTKIESIYRMSTSCAWQQYHRKSLLTAYELLECQIIGFRSLADIASQLQEKKLNYQSFLVVIV